MTILLLNTTTQAQNVSLMEPVVRRTHTVTIIALGHLEIESGEVTQDVLSKVDSGVLKSYDYTTRKPFNLKTGKIEDAKDEEDEQIGQNGVEPKPERGSLDDLEDRSDVDRKLAEEVGDGGRPPETPDTPDTGKLPITTQDGQTLVTENHPGETAKPEDRPLTDQVVDKGATLSKDEESAKEGDEDGLVHVGGGTYELPDGNRVKGRSKALEALTELRKEEAEKQEGKE